MADRTGRMFGGWWFVWILFSWSHGVAHLAEAAPAEPVLEFVLVLVLRAAVLVVGFV